MELNEIKHYLNENRYFINRYEMNGEVSDKLSKKINNNDFEVLDNIRTPNGLLTAYQHCLNQVNNSLLMPEVAVCSLDEILPVIKATVFENHRIRERKIQQHIDLCQQYETEENELSPGRYLVYWKKRGTKIYGIILEESLTEVPGNLIDEESKENAIRVEYPKMLRTALRDELKNEYAEAYAKEVEKYHSI